jgi:hypothetical protein
MVKAQPFDTISGSSVISGQASSVVSGHYAMFYGHAEGAMYGKPIETLDATIGVGAGGTNNTPFECRDACNSDSSCWGFYYDGDTFKCYLRTGFEAEGARSFLNMAGPRMVFIA